MKRTALPLAYTLFIWFLTVPSFAQTEKILGADISFLPQLEAQGKKFYDRGVQKDAIRILKDHGFNYIRLRIFNNPSADSGYSPGKGFCNLRHTKQMAKRIKAEGMKFLLDFHYSDTWADPGKQYKPEAWKYLNFTELTKALHDFTKQVTTELKQQGTAPDVVQIGNEIDHGILWPTGSAENIDSLVQLLKAGIVAVREVDTTIKIMLHIALGGQNEESKKFIDNMLAKNVGFDIIGESYYPKWHGTIDDLKNNLTDLAKRYKQDVIVAEYSEYKKEVNEIAFSIEDQKIKGTFIWEPLNTWEAIFDKNGNANALIDLYDDISGTYKVR